MTTSLPNLGLWISDFGPLSSKAQVAFPIAQVPVPIAQVPVPSTQEVLNLSPLPPDAFSATPHNPTTYAIPPRKTRPPLEALATATLVSQLPRFRGPPGEAGFEEGEEAIFFDRG